MQSNKRAHSEWRQCFEWTGFYKESGSDRAERLSSTGYSVQLGVRVQTRVGRLRLSSHVGGGSSVSQKGHRSAYLVETRADRRRLRLPHYAGGRAVPRDATRVSDGCREQIRSSRVNGEKFEWTLHVYSMLLMGQQESSRTLSTSNKRCGTGLRADEHVGDGRSPAMSGRCMTIRQVHDDLNGVAVGRTTRPSSPRFRAFVATQQSTASGSTTRITTCGHTVVHPCTRHTLEDTRTLVGACSVSYMQMRQSTLKWHE